MTSEKQRKANRQNAKKSTGPRTEDGKAHTSQNALKHGLLARDAVLPGEDPAVFDRHFRDFEDTIEPQNALEFALVRQIADAEWRLRRLARIETAFLADACDRTLRAKQNHHPDRVPTDYEGETLLMGEALRERSQDQVNFARYKSSLCRDLNRAVTLIRTLRRDEYACNENLSSKTGRRRLPKVTFPEPPDDTYPNPYDDPHRHNEPGRYDPAAATNPTAPPPASASAPTLNRPTSPWSPDLPCRHSCRHNLQLVVPFPPKHATRNTRHDPSPSYPPVARGSQKPAAFPSPHPRTITPARHPQPPYRFHGSRITVHEKRRLAVARASRRAASASRPTSSLRFTVHSSRLTKTCRFTKTRLTVHEKPNKPNLAELTWNQWAGVQSQPNPDTPRQAPRRNPFTARKGRLS